MIIFSTGYQLHFESYLKHGQNIHMYKVNSFSYNRADEELGIFPDYQKDSKNIVRNYSEKNIGIFTSSQNVK